MWNHVTWFHIANNNSKSNSKGVEDWLVSSDQGLSLLQFVTQEIQNYLRIHLVAVTSHHLPR